jgi:antitoxin HicB
MRYAVRLTPDDDGTLLVTVPDLPEAITFGVDREDALARAVDAIETAIIGRIAAREDIPVPRAKGVESVQVDPAARPDGRPRNRGCGGKDPKK